MAAQSPEKKSEKSSDNGASPDLSHVYDQINHLRRDGHGPGGTTRDGATRHGAARGAAPSESGEPQAKVQPDGSKLYSLKLDHKSSGHAGPDAMVLVPKNFDPSKPVHVVVYDHGWNDTAKTAVDNAQLVKQMQDARPNTVLVVPEWQQIPGSSVDKKNIPIGGLQGAFSKENQFEGMIDDVFKKVPELKSDTAGADGKPDKMNGAISQSTLNKIQDVSIVSHSAGFNAVDSELNRNKDLVGKVNNVTMLDSVYNRTGLQTWMDNNKEAIEKGEKHVTVIAGPTTSPDTEFSKKLKKWVPSENRLLRDWAHQHLPDLTLTDDRTHPGTLAGSSDLNNTPVVFRTSSMKHGDLPKNYLAIELEAEKQRASN